MCAACAAPAVRPRPALRVRPLWCAPCQCSGARQLPTALPAPAAPPQSYQAEARSFLWRVALECPEADVANAACGLLATVVATQAPNHNYLPAPEIERGEVQGQEVAAAQAAFWRQLLANEVVKDYIERAEPHILEQFELVVNTVSMEEALQQEQELDDTEPQWDELNS